MNGHAAWCPCAEGDPVCRDCMLHGCSGCRDFAWPKTPPPNPGVCRRCARVRGYRPADQPCCTVWGGYVGRHRAAGEIPTQRNHVDEPDTDARVPDVVVSPSPPDDSAPPFDLLLAYVRGRI